MYIILFPYLVFFLFCFCFVVGFLIENENEISIRVKYVSTSNIYVYIMCRYVCMYVYVLCTISQYSPQYIVLELHLSEGSEGSDPYFTVYYIENNMLNVLELFFFYSEISLCVFSVLKTTNWGLEVLYDEHMNHYI